MPKTTKHKVPTPNAVPSSRWKDDLAKRLRRCLKTRLTRGQLQKIIRPYEQYSVDLEDVSSDDEDVKL